MKKHSTILCAGIFAPWAVKNECFKVRINRFSVFLLMLALISNASPVYSQTPCDQRVISNVDFTYNGSTAPARWNMSQTNAGGFTIDQTAFAYVPTGNFASQNVDWQNANNNLNATRQYAIVKNPQDLSPQYANIPTDGMLVINPKQGENDQYGQFQIANLQPLQTYYVEIKFYNVLALTPRGPSNNCYSWCNWNNELNILWEGNGNNAHDGQSAMTWTGQNGSGNNSGNWDGWGNQVSNWMWVTPNGADAVMRGQMTLGDATTGFTFTFLKKDGSQTNPIVLGIDYIKVYGCQAEAINISGGSANVCEGTDLTLTAQGLGPAGSSYTWYQDGVLMPGRNLDTLNVISAIGIGSTVIYKAIGDWSNKSVTLTSKMCCSSVGGTSDEVTRQSFDGLSYTCTAGRSGGYADIPDLGTINFIDPVYVYAGTTCNSLNDGQYAVVQSSYAGDYWRNRPEVKDHTGTAGSGALFINAIGGVGQVFYKFNLNGLCSGTRYEFSAWYASLATGSETKPNVEFDVMNGATRIESVTTGVIPQNSTWYKAEVSFVTPATGNPTYTLQLVNLVSGSSGNDVMIDDIVVKKCTPNINLYTGGTKDTVLAVCNDNPVSLKVTTYYDLPLAVTGSSTGTVYYQWMKATSPNGPWALIGTPETTGSYLATPSTTPTYYRAKVSADINRAATGLPPLAAECGNDGITSSFKLTKDGSFTIPPVTGTTGYCPGAVMVLTGNSGTGDEWEWRKGASFAVATVIPGYAFSADPAKKVFTKTFVAGDEGNYYFVARLSSGCEGNASITVTMNPLPTATISGSSSICQNAASPAVTFTGANGTAPYTFTYNIGGGANLTVTTITGNSVNVAVPTSATGAFVYNLVGVAGNGAASCSNTVTGQSATVTVNPLPTAGISGTITVQQNAASPTVTFTGANGTAPYTFTYNINGGSNLTISTVAGNTVTLNAPTNLPGTFAYNLVSVKDASAALCSSNATGTATVTISNLPGAAITGTTTVCKNAAAPNITFTGSNGIAPYTFTYHINSGGDLTVTTVTGNSVTLAVPTGTSGIYTYTLTQVSESGIRPVTNAVSGQSATITINEVTPPAGINNSRCGTGTVTLTAALSGTATNIIKWYSDAALTLQVATGTSYTTPSISGTTNYYITESSLAGCSSTTTIVTAGINPGPGVPAATGASRCGTGIVTLTAALSGAATNIIKWYSDAALTAQVATGTSYTTPSITGTTNYYITESTSSDCASLPVTVTATINQASTAPASTGVSRCGTGTITLTATLSGATTDVIKWYSDAALATQVATGNTFITPSISASSNYYITETSVAGCASVSTTVMATVNTAPAAPASTGAARCGLGTVTLTATLSGAATDIVKWYSDAALTTQVAMGTSFTTPSISTPTNYYITETSVAGCASASTIVMATVNTAPAAPSCTGVARCGLGPVTLSATLSGAATDIVKWYSDAALTTQVATGNTFTTPSISATTNYYITETGSSGCASTATVVTATISEAASIPAASGSSRCGAGTVTLTGTLSGATTDVIKWYSDVSLTIQVATGSSFTTPSLTTSTGYYITETNTAGCVSAAATVTATVNAMPVAGFTAAVDCGNKSASFTNASNGNGETITEWAWNFDDGTGVHTFSNGNIVTWPYPTGGTHTVSLVVKNSSGCVSSGIFTTSISFGASPVAGFTTGNLCQANGSATFTNTSTINDGTLMTYSWDFGDGTPLVAVTPGAPPAPVTHVYATGNNYTVKLTATSTGGCINSSSSQVAIVNIPVANGSVDNINNLCSNKPVTVINQSGISGFGIVDSLVIYWDYSGNLNSLTSVRTPALNSNNAHQYPLSGIDAAYEIRIRAFNINGCVSGDFIQHITVHASPKIQFTALANICENADTLELGIGVFDIYSLGGSGVAINGSGVISNHLFVPASAGQGIHVIHYSDTAANGCFTDTVQTITVKPIPVSNFLNAYSVTEGAAITLQPSFPMDPGLSYQWTPVTVSSYMDNPASATPTVTNLPDDIIYQLLLTSVAGCTLETTVKINVLADFIVPNTFTPNSDGVNDTWRILKIDKYPTHRVQVFNRYGQIVYETRSYPATGWDGSLKGKSLPFGTYYYIIELGGVQYPKTGYVTILK